MAVALTFPLVSAADTPNLFQPKQMSSEAISVLIDTCMQQIAKDRPDVNQTWAWIYCSCTADAARAKGAKQVTVGDFSLCADAASKRVAPTKK